MMIMAATAAAAVGRLVLGATCRAPRSLAASYQAWSGHRERCLRRYSSESRDDDLKVRYLDGEDAGK